MPEPATVIVFCVFVRGFLQSWHRSIPEALNEALELRKLHGREAVAVDRTPLQILGKLNVTWTVEAN